MYLTLQNQKEEKFTKTFWKVAHELNDVLLVFLET